MSEYTPDPGHDLVFTPSLEDLREAWIKAELENVPVDRGNERQACSEEFDRAIADFAKAAKVEALREAVESLPIEWEPVRLILSARARRIEAGEGA
ncbi:hypothetical protein [Demequina globuliformis]|uniref:hypothetical protein n=1 Tax=Demequina globuliformis TaxID=676202 RepID=UPI00078281EF|nr:hypothetical protein [Demequina globuliformis]